MERTKGYVFGTKLKTEAITGVARTTHDMMSLNKIFGGEHQINNHTDGFIIRDAKRRIARAIGIDEKISNNALRILFAPMDTQFSIYSEEEKEFERNHKLIDGLSLKEYNAFLVNNRDRLIKVFSDINANQIAVLEETDIVMTQWVIPREQYYRQHKRIPSTKVMNKNPFVDYGNNILIQPNRTVTEIAFEKWCEEHNTVAWCYKNGDKGDEFFSIVYRMAFRRSNFYPDYIVELTNGDVWIIEAKGGMSADGGSNNIDKFADCKSLYNMHSDARMDKRINMLISGLEKIVSSISDMRNKNSDAHGVGKNRIAIDEHHARLFVNVAIALADFILSVGKKANVRQEL